MLQAILILSSLEPGLVAEPRGGMHFGDFSECPLNARPIRCGLLPPGQASCYFQTGDPNNRLATTLSREIESSMTQQMKSSGWQDMTDYESFEEILFFLSEIRESLSQIFRSVNSDPLSGRKSARQLGLDRNLAWRVSKFVGATDLLAAAPDVPTPKQVDRICNACLKHGAKQEEAYRVHETLRNYEEFVLESAGNREYFEALVSGLVVEDVNGKQENVRREAFFANVAQWGVQARVDFKTVVYSPKPDDENLLDIMRLGGRVDFKRSRQISWPLHRAHWYSDDGATKEVELEPVCRRSGHLNGGVALIEDFCSQPIPELIYLETSYGSRIDLPGTGFGNAGSLTTVFGDVNRGGKNSTENARWRGPNMDYHASMNDLYTPTELVVHDVFVHRQLDHFGPPEIMLLDRLSATRGYNPTVDEHSTLPLSTKVVRIGARAGAASIQEYPEYVELLKYSFEAVGWDSKEFIGYRFMMKYPTMPSATVVRFPLESKPA